MLKLEKKPIEHLKNKISAIPYILSPEVILFIFVTAAFISNLPNLSPLLSIMEAIAFILFAIAGIKTCRNNEGKKYLYCFHSVIRPKCVWICQKSFILHNDSKCPQKEFVRELMDIQKELKGTSVGTAYMITHTLIKDHILKTFSNVYVREAYYGKVGQRRYDLRNKNCDTCKVKSCSTKQKKDKDTFFCIRIDL